MLEDICKELNNYFEVKKFYDTYTISEGQISSGHYELQKGQYFRIVGSVLNDGVYEYPTENLKDETFEGSIWAMVIPPAVVSLSAEIDKWMAKYADKMDSPYQSESFGGYSYTKTSGGSASGNSATWQTVFRSRLNKWRKIGICGGRHESIR